MRGPQVDATPPSRLEPGPGRPEIPDDRVVVGALLHRDELLALPALLERELVLRRGPDVQALARLGVRVHIVEVTIPLVGDQLSRRRERLEMGKLRGRVGDLLLESRRGQELFRRQRLPLALSREVERWPPSVLPSK